MQSIFDLWLPKYYPRLDSVKVAALLKDASRWQLSTQEFQYIVLGCGYLYRVHPPDPEIAVRRVRRQVTAQYGRIAAEAMMDEGRVRKIRTLTKEQGLLIGPANRRLSERRKSGQLPHPAPRIAALVIARWVCKRRPLLKPSPWACDLHASLTSRNLTSETFARYQKVAEKEVVSVWIGTDEKRIPAIDHLLTFFDNRYSRFQQDGFPIQSAHKNPGILYPIDFLDPVLRAVGMGIEEKKLFVASFFPGRP